MTYAEVESYLYSQLPMYQRIGNSAYKANLDNIIALSDALGKPHLGFRTVHVAGTNGKGSSSHMLAAILQTAGYKTGLYTSPHLKNFTERVKINGIEIEKEYVRQFVVQQKSLFEQIRPSFFEMTVALAFCYFKEQKVDVAVIEVGLGGRLDSTNIITPLVSLITNIGMDHMNLLGDTIELIAAEKAGIIKHGVPAVVSEKQPEIEHIFTGKAAQENAPLTFASEIFELVPKDNSYRVYIGKKLYFDELKTDLKGDYQKQNIGGVLQTIEELVEQGFAISEENILNGLAHAAHLTGLKGRWQTISDNPLTICDTGHNEHGLKEVLKQLLNLQPKQVHFVFGTVNDKDPDKILGLLPKSYRYYFCAPQIPRAMPVAELARAAFNLGLQGQTYASVAEALQSAQAAAESGEMVFVGGSNFVVAEVPDL